MGHLTFAALCRRPVLSILFAVHRFVQGALRAANRVVAELQGRAYCVSGYAAVAGLELDSALVYIRFVIGCGTYRMGHHAFPMAL